MKDLIAKHLKEIIAIVSCIVTVLIGLGRSIQKQKQLEKRLKAMEALVMDSKGNSLFVKKSECEEKRETAIAAVYKEIAGIRVMMEKMEEKREAARQENAATMKEILIFMGRVQQFMEDE